MPKDFAVAVLISGRGSNLKALIDSAENYRISAVLSNNPEAGGLALARQASIPAIAFDRGDFPALGGLKERIRAECKAFAPDLIALAGFMQIIQPEFADEFTGRMVNIHPALLPKFPGLHTHSRALAAGESVHGCTVHFVDAGVDTGPVIAQARCPVMPGDDEERLAARVLELEHRLYPWVVNQIAGGGIKLHQGRAAFSPAALKEAGNLSFSTPNP